jgi:hypothetical protein
MTRERKVFGHKVSEKGIGIDKSGFEQLKNYLDHMTLKDYKTLLGMLGFIGVLLKTFLT